MYQATTSCVYKVRWGIVHYCIIVICTSWSGSAFVLKQNKSHSLLLTLSIHYLHKWKFYKEEYKQLTTHFKTNTHTHPPLYFIHRFSLPLSPNHISLSPTLSLSVTYFYIFASLSHTHLLCVCFFSIYLRSSPHTHYNTHSVCFLLHLPPLHTHDII